MRIALQSLCQEYWPPVYSFIRKQGAAPEDAEDLTQGFFAHLLQSKWFAKADPSRGRMRGFLFSSLESFLHNARRAGKASKRDHRRSVQIQGAESMFTTEPADHLTPDLAFHRRWVLTMIERVVEEMSGEYASRNQAAVFAAILPRLGDSSIPEEAGEFSDLAASLGMQPVSLRVALSRAREVFRTKLFDEVGRTITSEDPAEIRAELQALLGFL